MKAMRRSNGWAKAAVWTIGTVAADQTHAQSLFQRPVGVTQKNADGSPNYAAQLYGVSLFVIQPPAPVTFSENDLVQIIVNENSRATRSQSVESDKSTSGSIKLPTLQALQQLVELRAVNPAMAAAVLDPIIEAEKTFEGEGTYERRDDVVARVTAKVLEVKPNGNLLIEARTSIQTDDETQTLVLSGYCRSEDVTSGNTLFSNQVYDLRVRMEHQGELRDTNERGAISSFFNALLDF